MHRDADTASSANHRAIVAELRSALDAGRGMYGGLRPERTGRSG